MHNWGTLDYAGGTAVHINAGVAALAASIMLGRRKGYPHTPMPAHNLSPTMTGAAMLWVGWFGFNIGSGGTLNGTAGIIGWMFTKWFKVGKPSALGLASGALAGLVGITPACAYVGIGGALAIGLLCGVGCYLSIALLKRRFSFGDTLDVFGLHGIGGIIVALQTGVFCVPSLGGYVPNVTIASQLLAQIKGVGFTFIYCFVVSWIVLKVVKAWVGLRAHESIEDMGLDMGEHNESAYNH